MRGQENINNMNQVSVQILKFLWEYYWMNFVQSEEKEKWKFLLSKINEGDVILVCGIDHFMQKLIVIVNSEVKNLSFLISDL